jgi:hypothetical protein
MRSMVAEKGVTEAFGQMESGVSLHFAGLPIKLIIS